MKLRAALDGTDPKSWTRATLAKSWSTDDADRALDLEWLVAAARTWMRETEHDLAFKREVGGEIDRFVKLDVDLMDAFASLPGVDDQVRVARQLAESGIGIRLVPVIAAVAETVRAGRDSGSLGRESAAEALASLVRTRGVVDHRPENLDLLFRGWSADDLALALPSILAHRYVDSYADFLALALVRLPDVGTRALRLVYGSDGDDRVADLVRRLGRAAASGNTDARAGLEAIAAGAGDLALLASSALRHDDEMSALFSRYLDAGPANHDEVFDLLSSSRPAPQPERFLPWGLGGVISMSWSGSLLYSDRERPDFDTRRVLREVQPETLDRLVAEQTDPRLALGYLRLVKNSRHPGYDAVRDRALSQPSFVERVRQAEPGAADALFHGLLELSSRYGQVAPSARSLARLLRPKLSLSTWRACLFDLEHLCGTDDASQELVAAAERAERLSDLLVFREVWRNLGLEATVSSLSAIEGLTSPRAPMEGWGDSWRLFLYDLSRVYGALPSLADRAASSVTVLPIPRAPACDAEPWAGEIHELQSWFESLGALALIAPATAGLLLERLDTEAVEVGHLALAAWRAPRGLYGEGASAHLLLGRAIFLHALLPTHREAIRDLVQHGANEHIQAWVWADVGKEMVSHVEPGTAARVWLDLVAEVELEVAGMHLVALLQHAVASSPDPWARVGTIADVVSAARFARTWIGPEHAPGWAEIVIRRIDEEPVLPKEPFSALVLGAVTLLGPDAPEVPRLVARARAKPHRGPVGRDGTSAVEELRAWVAEFRPDLGDAP